jgi:translation initiation factor 2 subunit 1
MGAFAMAQKDEWPKEGELLVVTIKTVRQNGAYAKLDSYGDKEGFIFIGEISSGWVKNIRGHVREGQRVIAKVMRVKKDRNSVELSLKSVSEERKRDTLQSWKNSQRASQLFRIVGERSGWGDDEIEATADELSSHYGNLYAAFEETAIENEALRNEGFEGDWIDVFIELAIENIVPPFVTIRANADIEIVSMEGIEVIRTALSKAESVSNPTEEVEVCCYYDGAPTYRIELQAPDWKAAEASWQKVLDAITESVSEDVGTVNIERD